MTAEPGIPLTSCPSSLVAACPSLLGFQPEESLVAVIHGVPDRAGPVVMRADLPHDEELADWVDAVVVPMVRTGGRTADLVAWVPCADEEVRSAIGTAPVMQRLSAELGRVGLGVGRMLSTNGRVWWSHGCEHPWCCPETASELDASVVTRVRAEYAYAGWVALPSRQALHDTIARDVRRSARVGAALDELGPMGDEGARDAEIEWATRLLMPSHERGAPTMGDRDAARLHRSLADIHVRDTLLRRIVVADDCCAGCRSARIEVLSDLVRCAPATRGAPGATVLGLVAWMYGAGALASEALARASAEDPGYSLAALARRLVAAGVDPRHWRSSIATLSESQCRGRAGARSARPA